MGAQRRAAGLRAFAPVAIIGMACTFPQSVDLQEFWTHLESSDDLVDLVPEERHLIKAEEAARGVRFTGGFVRGVEHFDHQFFHVNRREAEYMDPQQRMALQATWRAVEDAGYSPGELSSRSPGVFFGAMTCDHALSAIACGVEPDAYMASGSVGALVANRISYLLNWGGPSLSIDTACSSSLVALHYAVASLQAGMCGVAIAGGVNAMFNPAPFLSLAMAGMIQDDGRGRCRTFDRAADGYVRGEGVGVVVLKRLDDALRDGDRICGVIRGSHVNHGGRANTLTSPSMLAQAELLYQTYATAGISPDTVSYVELHGTGTALGDPIEFLALRQAFSELGEHFGVGEAPRGRCGLGSVKTNIGHLEAAAGIAGVIKVLLALRHGRLPGNVHFQELNPKIAIDDSPFYVVERTRDWERPIASDGAPAPRRAGVSSFGFGGTNAHVVLEEWPDGEAAGRPRATPETAVFCLSARSAPRLREYLERWLAFLGALPEARRASTSFLHDSAFTLQVGREEMEERYAVAVRSFEELAARVASRLRGGPVAEVAPGGVEELSAQAAAAMRARDDDRLADLWMRGARVDWSNLPFAHERRRVTGLPSYPFAAEPVLLSKLADRGRIDGHAACVAATASPATPGQSEAPGASGSREQYRGYLKQLVADTLKMRLQVVDTGADLMTYGIDSINVASMVKNLRRYLGREIDASLLFQYPTIDALAEHLARGDQPEVTAQHGGPA
jgi:acyl transferase domain-containing protein